MRGITYEELRMVRGGVIEAPKPNPGSWGRSDYPPMPVEPMPDRPPPVEGPSDMPPVLVP